MTEEQLQQLRRQRWHLDSNPIRTLEEARDFITQNGFCLMYPIVRPMLLAPTFIGAYLGGDDNLPVWQHAAGDERAQQAQELSVRLLREKSAYEANVFGHTSFLLLSATVFPFFYALAGSRNPKQPPQAKPGAASPLAVDAFVALQKHGPLNKEKLGQMLGGALSEAALDRALNELWLELRITRVDYVAGEGAYWDVLYRWSPEVVREGTRISIPEAVSALISQYLQCMVVADESEIENFLNVLVPRTKVKEVIKALLAGRELEQIVVGSRTLLKLAGEPLPESPQADIAAERPDFLTRTIRTGADGERLWPQAPTTGEQLPYKNAGDERRSDFADARERRQPERGGGKRPGWKPRPNTGKAGSIRSGRSRGSRPEKFRSAAEGQEGGRGSGKSKPSGRGGGKKSYHGVGPEKRSGRQGFGRREQSFRTKNPQSGPRSIPPSASIREKKERDEDKAEG